METPCLLSLSPTSLQSISKSGIPPPSPPALLPTCYPLVQATIFSYPDRHPDSGTPPLPPTGLPASAPHPHPHPFNLEPAWGQTDPVQTEIRAWPSSAQSPPKAPIWLRTKDQALTVPPRPMRSGLTVASQTIPPEVLLPSSGSSATPASSLLHTYTKLTPPQGLCNC